MFLQYTHSFTGIFFLRSMCSVACCCSDILFWPCSCHQAALAFYKSQCRPTNLSVNEMLHFIVMQSGIIKKTTTTKQNHKYANTCMTPALLSPVILTATYSKCMYQCSTNKFWKFHVCSVWPLRFSKPDWGVFVPVLFCQEQQDITVCLSSNNLHNNNGSTISSVTFWGQGSTNRVLMEYVGSNTTSDRFLCNIWGNELSWYKNK